jgi:Cu/Ag efflux pump CusA
MAKPGDIRRVAATLVSGDEVSDIHRNSKVYDIMVWSTPDTRRSVADIRQIPLDTPGGWERLVKELRQLARTTA